MTEEMIGELLKKCGLPVAEDHFEKGEVKGPPFLTYDFPEYPSFYADDKNYLDIARLRVSLCCAKKDRKREKTLEKILKEADIPYEKTRLYIEESDMYETVYETEVAIDG